MLKLLRYLKAKDWALVLTSILFIIFQVYLDLKMPEYMSEITLLVQTPGSEIGEIWQAGGWMLACALGSMAAAILVGYFAARVASSLAKALRQKLFYKTLDFSMEEINGFSTASLITRTTNDIRQIQMVVAMGLQVMIKAPIMSVWAILKISGKSWQWSAATVGVLAFLFVVISVLILFALPKFRKIQTLTDNLNRITRENLTGIRVVRAYNAEGYQENKFENANQTLANNHLFTGRLMALMQPTMQLVMSTLTLLIYWIGANLIETAALMEKQRLFSDMVVFTSYAMQVIMSFVMLTIIFILLPRASVSAARINEVLNKRLFIRYGKRETGETGRRGEVELRNVSFKYPDAEDYVLRDVSFTARQGEIVAFIGATGSGKSTLINLIPRFYDVAEGEVLVDGVNVKEYTEEALNNKLGYVSQRATLFSGTVRSNVAYGKKGGEPFTDEQVREAVEIAQGAEFVEKLDGGYDARIAQGGMNVSGGQKQRISIARAVCRDPEIFIFDDSFSALDYKTDRKLRSALKRATKDATTLIVAQRIGTIKDADKIIVLDEGRLVGIGPHDALMKECETYREIAYSQLSKEELENA